MSLLRSPAPYSSLFKLNKLQKNVTLFVSWHFWADVIRWLTSFKSIRKVNKANAVKKRNSYSLSSVVAKNCKRNAKECHAFCQLIFWADVIRWLTSFKSIRKVNKANAVKKRNSYSLSSVVAKNCKRNAKECHAFCQLIFWADVIRWLTSFKSIGNDKKANALKKQIPYLLSSAFAKNYKISEKSLKLWKAFKQFLTTISKIGSYTTWITGILYLP